MSKTREGEQENESRIHLGGFTHVEGDLTYVDSSEGKANCLCRGHELIRRGEETAYELDYHGGLIKD